MHELNSSSGSASHARKLADEGPVLEINCGLRGDIPLFGVNGECRGNRHGSIVQRFPECLQARILQFLKNSASVASVKNSIQSQGGKARAKALSAKRRSEIARKAVKTRWKKAKEGK